LLHPTQLSEFQEMQIKETEWNYIDLETNLWYKVYAMK
jgi:hypothetical protein